MKDGYEIVKNGCLERGFILDSSREYIESMKKATEDIDVHCSIHTDNKLHKSWAIIKAGRCKCKECKKIEGRHDYTIEEKIQILYDAGFEYIEGNLGRVSESVKLKRIECGHIIDRPFNNIIRGNISCPFCKGVVPAGYWDKETCQEWLDQNMKGYKIIDTKRDRGELRVFIKCPNKDHNPYWTSWMHIKNERTGCKECYYKSENKINWNVDKVKAKLNEIGLSILNDSDYVSTHARFAAKDSLGFIYMVTMHNIVRGRQKFSLWRNNPYALHNIHLYCKIFRPDYEFLDNEYKGNKEIHRWRYLGDQLEDNIDREFDLIFGNFVNANSGHPMLSKSKLEAKCQYILDKYNIRYTPQKTFDDCKDKILLRFDFYTVINNNEYCIETDGNQHDIPIPKFGGLKYLEDIQRKDSIKNEYCKKNNIKLIRIKEKDFKNMENILIKELNLDGLDLEEYVG